MKRTGLGHAFLRRCTVGRLAFAVAVGAMVLIKSGCSACLEYMQTVEIAVTNLEGRPAAGVKVYEYVYNTNSSQSPEDQTGNSVKREAALQRKRPELFRGVNHQTDASGHAVIPVFDRQSLSPLPLLGLFVPRKLDEKGAAGKVWVIAVDDGVNVDKIPFRLLPGASAHGEHWRVEIRSLSTPQEYSYSDANPSENSM